MSTPSNAPATPSPAIQPDVQWRCEIAKPSDALTVGQKFELSCEGPPAKLGPGAASVLLPQAQKHALKLLETRELTETSAKFVATSHVAGEIKLQNPILTDGKIKIGLGPIGYQVETVIKPETNPEGKPLPPWGPLTLGWPLGVWLVIGALLASLVGLLYFAARRSLQRKRLVAELERRGTALSPYNQFNKELRVMVRKYPVQVGVQWSPELAAEYMSELNQSFRWFLARELIVPAFEFSPQRVANELKKIDPKLFKESRRELVLALGEIDKSLEATARVSADDANQITDLCRRLAERIAKARAG